MPFWMETSKLKQNKKRHLGQGVVENISIHIIHIKGEYIMKRHTKKQWTYKDDMEMIKLFNEGRSTRFIAEYFGRTKGAISGRLSQFRNYGYIEGQISPRSDYDSETIAEMKDAITRFEKISSIPMEWKMDWAERNDKNLLQVGDELSRLYKKERGGAK